jgi:hypothetical protein
MLWLSLTRSHAICMRLRSMCAQAFPYIFSLLLSCLHLNDNNNNTVEEDDSGSK